MELLQITVKNLKFKKEVLDMEKRTDKTKKEWKPLNQTNHSVGIGVDGWRPLKAFDPNTVNTLRRVE